MRKIMPNKQRDQRSNLAVESELYRKASTAVPSRPHGATARSGGKFHFSGRVPVNASRTHRVCPAEYSRDESAITATARPLVSSALHGHRRAKRWHRATTRATTRALVDGVWCVASISRSRAITTCRGARSNFTQTAAR
jgi:hypothetical protein